MIGQASSKFFSRTRTIYGGAASAPLISGAWSLPSDALWRVRAGRGLPVRVRRQSDRLLPHLARGRRLRPAAGQPGGALQGVRVPDRAAERGHGPAAQAGAEERRENLAAARRGLGAGPPGAPGRERGPGGPAGRLRAARGGAAAAGGAPAGQGGGDGDGQLHARGGCCRGRGRKEEEGEEEEGAADGGKRDPRPGTRGCLFVGRPGVPTGPRERETDNPPARCFPPRTAPSARWPRWA